MQTGRKQNEETTHLFPDSYLYVNYSVTAQKNNIIELLNQNKSSDQEEKVFQFPISNFLVKGLGKLYPNQDLNSTF